MRGEICMREVTCKLALRSVTTSSLKNGGLCSGTHPIIEPAHQTPHMHNSR
jgi:hypothetical protein